MNFFFYVIVIGCQRHSPGGFVFCPGVVLSARPRCGSRRKYNLNREVSGDGLDEYVRKVKAGGICTPPVQAQERGGGREKDGKAWGSRSQARSPGSTSSNTPALLVGRFPTRIARARKRMKRRRCSPRQLLFVALLGATALLAHLADGYAWCQEFWNWDGKVRRVENHETLWRRLGHTCFRIPLRT